MRAPLKGPVATAGVPLPHLGEPCCRANAAEPGEGSHPGVHLEALRQHHCIPFDGKKVGHGVGTVKGITHSGAIHDENSQRTCQW